MSASTASQDVQSPRQRLNTLHSRRCALLNRRCDVFCTLMRALETRARLFRKIDFLKAELAEMECAGAVNGHALFDREIQFNQLRLRQELDKWDEEDWMVRECRLELEAIDDVVREMDGKMDQIRRGIRFTF